MINPSRRISYNLPDKLIKVDDGLWYYNYDIQEHTVKDIDTGNECLMYNFIPVSFTYKPSYKDCVEAVIRKYITVSQEFDLINSANRVLLSMGTEKAVPSEYLEYLDLVDEIKNKVQKDFEL